MIKIILSLLLLAVLQACRYSCTPFNINPAFVGFAPSDVDTFVIREYQPNSNFLNLVDTVLIVNGAAVYTQSNDTIIAFLNLNPPEPLHSGYDWQIYIPSKNRTITLTGIMDEQRDGSNKNCHDGISSFKQDGQQIVAHLASWGAWYNSGYFAYINNN